MGVDNPAKVIELSIHGTVYDVTEFAKEHPGGTVIVSKANPDHLPWSAALFGLVQIVRLLNDLRTSFVFI